MRGHRDHPPGTPAPEPPPPPKKDKPLARAECEALGYRFNPETAAALDALHADEKRQCNHCGGETPCPCLASLGTYHSLMRLELEANYHKGGRNGERGWLTASPDALLAEIYDHLAKLHVATRELARRRSGAMPRPMPWLDDHYDTDALESRVKEFGADVGNMTHMLLDTLELLL